MDAHQIFSHVFGPTFVMAGVAVILYSASLFLDKRAFLQRALGPAEGRVIRRVRGGNPDTLSWFHPVVLFQTRDGREVVFQSDEAMVDAHCRVGTLVRVFYDAVHPERARIADRKWFDPAMAFVLGLLVTAAGAVLLSQGVNLRPLLSKGRSAAVRGQATEAAQPQTVPAVRSR